MGRSRVTSIIVIMVILLSGAALTIWIFSSSFHRSADSAPPPSASQSQSSPISSQPEPSAPPTVLARFDLPEVRHLDKNGQSVTALCVDAQNQLWAGTKSDGLRRYNPYAPSGLRWTVFDDPNSVGQAAICSLGVDRRGRVWAGLEAGGVIVFDGIRWQKYDTVGGAEDHSSLSGPLGGHIFQIRICPTDGAVWLATEAGLTRFDDATGRWTYFTQADGLPSDATDAITFNSAGDIFAGTQCDGIAMADAADGYKHWRTVSGPTQTSTTATGDGLPSNCINDLATTTTGLIYAATVDGLAWSADDGKTWKYQHGRTWVDRLESRPQGLPPDWTAPDDFEMDGDLVHRLSIDQKGNLYLAYEAGGVQEFSCDPDGSPTKDIEFSPPHQQFRTLPADMTGFSVGGGFGMGVIPFVHAAMLSQEQPPLPKPGLPPGASAPSAADIAALLPATGSDEPSTAPAAMALDDDWRTTGTWLGRYGRDWAHLPGIEFFGGYIWGAGVQPSNRNIYVGPGDGQGGIAWYFHDETYYDDPHILELPQVYLNKGVQQKLTTVDKNRMFGEMNDGDFNRKASFFGPGLYYDLNVPAGPFILSMYLVNNDGVRPGTAERDFAIEIRQGRGTHDVPLTGPPLSHERVTDFCNGVWKRFYIRGPGDFSVLLQKQTVPSVKFSALTLDRPTDLPDPYFSWQSPPPLSTDTPAGQLAAALRAGPTTHPRWWSTQKTRAAILLARWCQSQTTSAQTTLVESVALYNADLFDAFESCQKCLGLRSARDLETSLRWNPAHPDDSGLGASDLKEYLDGLKPAKANLQGTEP